MNQHSSQCSECGCDVNSENCLCLSCENKRLTAEVKNLTSEVKNLWRLIDGKEGVIKKLKKERDTARAAEQVAQRALGAARRAREEVCAEAERHSKALFTTLRRLQKIVMYYGTDEVDAAVKRWNEGDGDGMTDWIKPPPGVDEVLEGLS